MTGLAWVEIPAWVESAACASTDPELFFPEKGGSAVDAKRVCHSCPVRSECLDWALEGDERFGVWGGKSAVEREGMARPLVQPVRGGRDPMRTTALLREHGLNPADVRTWAVSEGLEIADRGVPSLFVIEKFLERFKEDE